LSAGLRGPDPERPFLLIPGPTEVHPDVAAAALEPMIAHRGEAMEALLADVLPRAARWIGTEAPVLPLACSSTGAMEAALRNAAPGPFLHLVAGAFSARWAEISRSCGLEGHRLEVEWGQALDPAGIVDALERRDYTAVTLVHNETSTGVMHPLAAIARAVREHSNALLLVDTVSSMSATPIDADALGVDLCLAGVQKAWALPAGLTLCSVSERALRRAEGAEGRGWYLDWVRHVEEIQRGRTPTTPPVSLLQQLRAQLDRMEAEGRPARFARHAAMRERVLEWARARGVEAFAVAEHRSPTVTALSTGGIASGVWIEGMRARGWHLAAGYGPLRDRLIRVGHMGEIDLPTLDRALADLSEVLGESSGSSLT
jgi:aspartate aminotransferase-like enzyme